MAEPDSIKLPASETTPLLQPSATDLPSHSSLESVQRYGEDVGPYAEGRGGTDGEGEPGHADRIISPKVAVAILTIGKFSPAITLIREISGHYNVNLGRGFHCSTRYELRPGDPQHDSIRLWETRGLYLANCELRIIYVRDAAPRE